MSQFKHYSRIDFKPLILANRIAIALCNFPTNILCVYLDLGAKCQCAWLPLFLEITSQLNCQGVVSLHTRRLKLLQMESFLYLMEIYPGDQILKGRAHYYCRNLLWTVTFLVIKKSFFASSRKHCSVVVSRWHSM